MKFFLTITLVLLLFLGFAWWNHSLLSSNSKEIGLHLSRLEKSVRNNQWENAHQELKSLEERWDRMKNKWQVLIDHQEVDNIGSSLVKVKEWVISNAKDDSLVEISNLRFYILHIPVKNRLSITNVF